MVRRVVLGGGVPLVGPQEELRGPSVYAPRGFTSRGGEVRIFVIFYDKQINKQTNKRSSSGHNHWVRSPPLEHGHVAATPKIDVNLRCRQTLQRQLGGVKLCSAHSVCLRARPYLHHALTRLYARPPTHITPLHVTTLHSHLPSAHNTLFIVFSVLYSSLLHTHTSQHIVFCKHIGPRLCVRFFVKGAHSMGLIHIHTKHSINTRKYPTPTPLGKVFKRALVVPSSTPHQRAFVCGACKGTAQVGVSLVPL